MPILSWYDDKDDQMLFEYLPILKEMSDVEDVRPFLMASVKDNILDIEKGMALMKAYKEQINQNLSKSKGSLNGLMSGESEATTSITNSTNRIEIN